jgi:monoamine oxidase
MKYDIIIIGAGCAGLMAMKELLAAGHSVCLLEASGHAGGRIATVIEKGFDMPVETGAEFIHGKLPLTRKLLRKAHIPYQPIEGRMVSVSNGKWDKGEAHEKHWGELMHQLRKQKTDITIRAFLEKYFSGNEYKGLRNAVQRFAEGFDLADIDKASILSVKKEWQHEEQTQYRIPGGYKQLVDYLQNDCLIMKGKLYFNCAARTIDYRRNHVMVTTSNKKKFEAKRLIVTASMGVLQAGLIKFKPGLGAQQDAIMQIGFGSVIKILLQFSRPFWKDKGDDAGFFITNEKIPTWWTQLPADNNLLTGWLGGSEAAKRSKQKEAIILRDALLSLSSVFSIEPTLLKKQLVHYKIVRWQDHKYVRGGYSYSTLFSEKAIEILSEPVAGTIFFAGEAIYSGESGGTVEAALQSGLAVAKKVAGG